MYAHTHSTSSNAIKFSQKKEVSLHCKVISAKSPEDAARLALDFDPLETGRTRKTPSLSRTLVNSVDETSETISEIANEVHLHFGSNKHCSNSLEPSSPASQPLSQARGIVTHKAETYEIAPRIRRGTSTNIMEPKQKRLKHKKSTKYMCISVIDQGIRIVWTRFPILATFVFTVVFICIRAWHTSRKSGHNL